jgi:hypothetical protein
MPEKIHNQQSQTALRNQKSEMQRLRANDTASEKVFNAAARIGGACHYRLPVLWPKPSSTAG